MGQEELLPPPGQLPDASGVAAATIELVPVGFELASVAVNIFSGKAITTSPALLAKPTAAATLPRVSNRTETCLPSPTSLTKMDNAQSGTDIASFAAEGLDDASFLASRAHLSSNSLVVDNAGRNAIQWIGDWLNLQINCAT